jgi:hypothetical protein
VGHKKILVPFAGKGAQVDDLKGPLPAYHVPDASSAADIAQMVEDIGKELAAVPQDFAVFQDKIAAVVRAAALADNLTVTKADQPTEQFDAEDVKTVLTGWVGDNLYSLNNVVITFSKLDSELGLPEGASAAHLQPVAEAAGAKLIRRGRATILFESPEVGGFAMSD